MMDKQLVASDTHDKVATKAGFSREETTQTTTNGKVRTSTRYSRASKMDKKQDWQPTDNITVSNDSDSGETIWQLSFYDSNGEWQNNSGSSSDTLKTTLG